MNKTAPVNAQVPVANIEFRSKFHAIKSQSLRNDLLKLWGPISIHGALIQCPQYWLNHEAGLTGRGFDLRRGYIKSLHAAVSLIQTGDEVPDSVFQEVVEGPGKDLVSYDTMRMMTRLIGAVIRAEMVATKAPVPIMIGKMTAVAREFDRRDMLIFNNDITITGRYYTVLRLRTLGKFSDTKAVSPELVENNYLRALSALASANGRMVRVNNILLMPHTAVMPVYWCIPSDFLKAYDTTASKEIARYLSSILQAFPEKDPKVIRGLTTEKNRPGCTFCQFRNEKNCANLKKV